MLTIQQHWSNEHIESVESNFSWVDIMYIHCKKLWVVSTSLYGCLSCTHVCRSNPEISLSNLLNKLYIISLLWYDILDNKDKLSNLFKKSSYVLMCHYVGRNKFVTSHPNFLNKFGLHLYGICHIKAGWFLTFCWTNSLICLKCDIL